MSGDAPRILLERDAELPLGHVSISTYSGASEDPAGKEGLLRLCTRLMRRTAGKCSPDDVDARVDRMGATLGVDCGHGSSALSGSVLSRSMDAYFELLEQALTEPGLFEEELERLKRETLAELIEVLDSDQHLVQRWFYRTLLAGHPYGRTVMGNRESLARIERSDVVRCHQERFSRGQLLFALAGDLDEARCRARCTALDASLPVLDVPVSEVPEPAPRPGRQLVFVDKPERTQTQILIGGLGSHPRDDDHFPLLVSNTVFGGTFTSRLTHEVRAKRGWSYGAYSSLGYDRRRQSFSMWTFPKSSDAAACVALQLELLERWWQEGITDAELESAKRYLVQSRAFARDTPSKRIGLVMDEILSDLPAGYHDQYVDRVQAVSREQANAAVRNRISLADLTLAVVGTHADIGGDVADAIPGLASQRVVPFDAD